MDKNTYTALVRFSRVLGLSFTDADLSWIANLGNASLDIGFDTDDEKAIDPCPVCGLAILRRSWVVQQGDLKVEVWEVDVHLVSHPLDELTDVRLRLTQADQNTLVQIFGGAD